MIQDTENRYAGLVPATDDKSRKVIEAFHLMWDFFPEPVRLIAKNRTVLAINRAAEKGGFQLNVKCSSMPPLEAHRKCKANAALSTKESQYVKWKGNIGDVVNKPLRRGLAALAARAVPQTTNDMSKKNTKYTIKYRH
jgi:hypothetical protein